MIKKKKAQVWIEAMTYTLIALAVIGAILAFVQPKVKQMQDKATIENSMNIMNQINSVIKDLGQSVPGNKRKLRIRIKKGNLKIDGVNNEITFDMPSKYKYSELGQNYKYGDLLILTQKENDGYNFSIALNYSQYNLTYEGGDTDRKLTAASNPYNLFIIRGKGIVINTEVN